jgi:hypothetical protein
MKFLAPAGPLAAFKMIGVCIEINWIAKQSLGGKKIDGRRALEGVQPLVAS